MRLRHNTYRIRIPNPRIRTQYARRKSEYVRYVRHRATHIQIAGSGSHKVPYVLVNSAASSGHISITIGFQTKNSSDLDVGRRPELKSDEFFVWNPIDIEIISLLFEIVGRSSCTLWEPDPMRRACVRARTRAYTHTHTGSRRK